MKANMILTGKNVHIYAQWPQWAKKGKKVQFISVLKAKIKVFEILSTVLTSRF